MRQMLRISLRLRTRADRSPAGQQTHPGRGGRPGGDTERVVQLADNIIDQFACVFILVDDDGWCPGRSCRPAVLRRDDAGVGPGGRPRSAPGWRSPRAGTVAARAAFATALVSSLSAARDGKLAGATKPVLSHLSKLDIVRSDLQRPRDRDPGVGPIDPVVAQWAARRCWPGRCS